MTWEILDIFWLACFNVRISGWSINLDDYEGKFITPILGEFVIFTFLFPCFNVVSHTICQEHLKFRNSKSFEIYHDIYELKCLTFADYVSLSFMDPIRLNLWVIMLLLLHNRYIFTLIMSCPFSWHWFNISEQGLSAGLLRQATYTTARLGSFRWVLLCFEFDQTWSTWSRTDSRVLCIVEIRLLQPVHNKICNVEACGK